MHTVQFGNLAVSFNSDFSGDAYIRIAGETEAQNLTVAVSARELVGVMKDLIDRYDEYAGTAYRPRST